ncbi:MAG TPA: PaaI family thioesterase [Bacillales bacterium]|nr:PaaI family thioesterase [Bacillales bacterium]
MGELTEHYRRLERMYLAAPVNNQLFENNITLKVSKENAELTLKILTKYFHPLNAIHGSIYFKLLDDAAFFAVNSIVEDAIVYTVSFNTHILRPVNSGIIRSIGHLKFKSKSLYVAESTLYDDSNNVVGMGTGNFLKSKIQLTEEIGYV